LQVPQPEAGQSIGAGLTPSREATTPATPIAAFVSLRASRDPPGTPPKVQSPALSPRDTAGTDTAPRVEMRPGQAPDPLPRPSGAQAPFDGKRPAGPSTLSSERPDPVAPVPAERTAPVQPKAAPVATRKKEPVPDSAALAPIASLSRPSGDATDLKADKSAKPTPGSLVKGFFSRRPKGRIQPAPPAPPGAESPSKPQATQQAAPQAKSADHPRPAKAASDGSGATTGKPGRIAAFKPSRKVDTQPKVAGGGAAVMSAQDSERERMTVFGARQKDRQIGGKPRFLGLMLTAALLILLAGVAAWASVFLDEGLARFFRPDVTPRIEIAEVSEDPDAGAAELAPDAAALPATPDAGTETGAQEDIALAAPVSEPTLPGDGTIRDSSGIDAPDVPAHDLTPEEADATYAATGIWQRSPIAPLEPQQTVIEDLYVASIDPEVQQFDAVALPAAQEQRRDVIYESPRSPLPADVVFDLTERGFVRATPEGAINPDGILIYAGLPPAVPPQRGASLALTQTEPVPDPGATESGAKADRFEAFRPKSRPGNLIERNERATLAGASVAELAAFRPKLRPLVEKQEEEADVTATDLAIGQSAKPLPRPRDIQRIVEAARVTPSAPAPASAREAESVQVAAVAPRTVAPSIPSNTSVAQQATVRNAINLRQLNLIGVYGKPSSRRALVRLSNGRYQKVKVGDSIDGGRVAAIGETELRYTKSGRNLVIKMPQG